MKLLPGKCLLLIPFSLSVLSAQNGDVAFSAAREIKDPVARVAAYRKVLTDFPASRPSREFIAPELIDSAIAVWPADAAKVVALAQEVLEARAGVIERANLATQFAGRLLDHDLALADAERFALQSRDAVTWEAFQPYILGTPAAKRHTPPESSVRNQFAASQASILSTLGQIYIREGKTGEGKHTLDEALEINPYLSDAARTLASLAAPGSADQLTYITQSYLAHPSPADRVKLKALYRATHQNSLTGLEPWLDTQYVKLLPRPAPLAAYNGTPKRTVLLELLTGSACPPCLGMDMAFDGLLERYRRDDVVILMYHQNRAGPDPMTNYATLDRFAYYDGVSAPTVILAGNVELGGGFSDRAAEFAARLSKDLDEQLDIPAAAQVKLSATQKGRDIPVRVTVDDITKTADHLTVRMVVVDKQLRYSGETGVRFHPMVVRAVADYPLPGAGKKTIEHRFNLDQIAADVKKYHDDFEKHDERFNLDGSYRWPARVEQIGEHGLAVAAFLQDDATKQILQAAWVDLSGTH